MVEEVCLEGQKGARKKRDNGKTGRYVSTRQVFPSSNPARPMIPGRSMEHSQRIVACDGGVDADDDDGDGDS